MNLAIKKISCVIFILLGLIPLLLTFIVTIQKEKIWERMKEKMETHELQTVVVSENDVVWMDDHEIWVNEHMFDIRTKKLENGVYTFTGMYDEEETKLVAGERKTGDRQNKESKILSLLFHFLQTIYHEQENESFSKINSINTFRASADALASVCSSILTPPPDQLA